MNNTVLQKISQHFEQNAIKTYAKGQVITMANEEPAGISMLVSGIVEQYDITPEGNKIVVNIYKPPAFFPMSWAINRMPNTFFFGALTEVKIRQGDAKEAVEFLKANPDVAFDLLSRVYKGTDTLLRRLALATRGIAGSRLAFELLLEAHRFGIPADNKLTTISVKQSVLATRCGLARETVSRELQKMEQAGLITRTGHDLTFSIENLEQKLSADI